VNRVSPVIAALWALTGAGTMVLSWHDAVRSGIQLAYLAMTALGGAAILIYQKKLSADREDRDANRAKDLARNLEFKSQVDAAAAVTTASALREVHNRLDAVIIQRDHQQCRSDQLFDQLRELTERVEKTRCVFPVDDHARCTGRESPPQ